MARLQQRREVLQKKDVSGKYLFGSNVYSRNHQVDLVTLAILTCTFLLAKVGAVERKKIMSSSDEMCCQICGKNLPNFGMYQNTCELCYVAKPKETTIQQDRAERWKRMFKDTENNGSKLGKLEVINQTYNG